MAERKIKRDKTLEDLKRDYEEAQSEYERRKKIREENNTTGTIRKEEFAKNQLRITENAYLNKKRSIEGISKEDVARREAFIAAGMGGGTSSFEATTTVIIPDTQNTQARIIDENPSKVDSQTGTAVYGSVELNTADGEVTESESLDLSKVVRVKKTPAPPIISPKNKETVTKLIEANPRNEKLQNIIKEYKETYPDDFKDVKAIPLDQLSPEEQEKRKTFVRATKECNIPDCDSVGKVLIRANPCRDTTFDKMEAQMTNFFDKVSGPAAAGLDMTNEIRQASKTMSRTMTTFVNKATGSLNDALEQSIGNGMGALKSSIYSKISRAFPVTSAMNQTISAQLGVAPAINGILDSVYCIGSKITDALEDTIADLLTAAIKNSTSTPACAVQEIMGAINNDVINQIDSFVTPQLDPLFNLLGPLGFNFDVKNFMTSGVNVMKKIEALGQSCDDRPKCPSSSKYQIGKGIMKGGTALSTIDNFSQIMKATAINQQITNLTTDFEKKYGAWNIFGSPLAEASGISPCYSGNPKDCGGSFVEIVGGGGYDGSAKTILGRFIDKLDTEDIFADVQRTASIVGIEITNPGNGYTSDPVIIINDKCNQGYGAFGKAHVDKNPQSPTYGQITSITMISTGENYPVNDEEVPLFINKVIIENGGYGYEDTDTLDDFELQIIDGRVISGTLVNQIAYNDLPELNINTATGVGAILRPIMSKTRPQGEVIEVIDCIGK